MINGGSESSSPRGSIRIRVRKNFKLAKGVFRVSTLRDFGIILVGGHILVTSKKGM